jgi:4-hydroxy-4-methyl-2-oxoglutarate aldolase
MDDLITRLGAVDTASLCDAGPDLRVLPPELRPLAFGYRLAGRAVTVDAGDDLMSVLGGLHAAGPGDVLVVATDGAGRAMAGELFGSEALRRGLAGIVIDGYCRDRATLGRLGLPVFARGTTPRAAPAQAVPRVGVPVRIGPVEIQPGDLVVGDDDGLITGTRAQFEAAIDTAEAVIRRESGLLASIQDGRSLFDALNFDDHAARRRAGEPSSLSFS